jgi:hypothetical protein
MPGVSACQVSDSENSTVVKQAGILYIGEGKKWKNR